LRGVFAVDWNQPAPDASDKKLIPNGVVHALVQHFSEIDLSNKSVPPDVLGRAYEYLIKQFADNAGAKAGEFFTRPEDVDTVRLKSEESRKSRREALAAISVREPRDLNPRPPDRQSRGLLNALRPIRPSCLHLGKSRPVRGGRSLHISRRPRMTDARKGLNEQSPAQLPLCRRG
jgi:hypothetical protein